jgi:membrane protein implicated in regulation of membrane protease activity
MDGLAGGLLGGLLLVVSLLIGAVVAIEAVVVVALLTVPLVGAVRRWLPWRRSADQRAAALLRELLTRDEFAHLCLKGYLEVASPSRPDRTYRIPRTRGTIDVYERGRYHSTLCIAPVIALPDDDVVAAHKLMILADEERYLATANRVLGARWEEPAPHRTPPRATERGALLRLLAAALATAAGVTLALHLAGQPAARDVVLAVVVGWPVALAVVSILSGIAVLLLGAVARPRRSPRPPFSSRRLA